MVDSCLSGSAPLGGLLDSGLRLRGESSALPPSMLLVWHTLRQKSRGSGHLVDWLVVRVFYCITDFTMLNTVNLGRFVTLTLAEFVTPQQVLHWLVA